MTPLTRTHSPWRALAEGDGAPWRIGCLDGSICRPAFSPFQSCAAGDAVPCLAAPAGPGGGCAVVPKWPSGLFTSFGCCRSRFPGPRPPISCFPWLTPPLPTWWRSCRRPMGEYERFLRRMDMSVEAGQDPSRLRPRQRALAIISPIPNNPDARRPCAMTSSGFARGPSPPSADHRRGLRRPASGPEH